MVANPVASALTADTRGARSLAHITRGTLRTFTEWSAMIISRLAAEGIKSATQEEYDALDPKQKARLLEVILTTVETDLLTAYNRPD